MPYRRSAPSGPAAFGRWTVQFCQAVSGPQTFLSTLSGPAERKFDPNDLEVPSFLRRR